MGLFETSQAFPMTVADLTPVAHEVMDHFTQQGYEVKGERTITRGWDISLHKGETFKAIIGMKTALKMTIEPAAGATVAKISVGIFGQQAIPTVISALFFWPVLIPQIWGLVQQAKLDDEAIHCVETSLKKYTSTGASATSTGTAGSAPRLFCTNCGAPVLETAKFCSECGGKV